MAIATTLNIINSMSHGKNHGNGNAHDQARNTLPRLISTACSFCPQRPMPTNPTQFGTAWQGCLSFTLGLIAVAKCSYGDLSCTYEFRKAIQTCDLEVRRPKVRIGFRYQGVHPIELQCTETKTPPAHSPPLPSLACSICACFAQDNWKRRPGTKVHTQPVTGDINRFPSHVAA